MIHKPRTHITIPGGRVALTKKVREASKGPAEAYETDEKQDSPGPSA